MNGVAAEQNATSASSTGWQAELTLGFEHGPVGTVLKQVSHRGPLRVQRPFYPEKGLPHVYLLHPPGGVVGSDRLDVTVKMAPRSQALITTPGSTKFYRSAAITARLSQRLKVKAGASLEWFPQENIIFSGAHLNSTTRIELIDDACFIGWEINCLGRPSSGERFDQGALFSRFALYRDQQPLLIESLRINREDDLHAATGLRGYPMQAILVATPCDQRHLEVAREQLTADQAGFPVAATLVDGVLIIRALGHQTEPLQQQLIPVWQALRPALLHRPAISPRIWAT